jgi:hypothetical protein
MAREVTQFPIFVNKNFRATGSNALDRVEQVGENSFYAHALLPAFAAHSWVACAKIAQADLPTGKSVAVLAHWHIRAEPLC